MAALIRGLTRRNTDRLGNFWVDLTRISLRVLLPLSFLAALVLVVSGVIQNLNPPTDVATIAGGTQTLPGGLVASQEAIKELGTNGGGYLNANSAHPFENPTAFTNLFEIFLLLVIPFSLPRTFGRMVGNAKQGLAILAAMAVLWVGALAATIALENAHPGVALQAAGAATEGKEVRFGDTDVRDVRGVDDDDVHRCHRLDPFLVHRDRRRGPAAEHAARRDLARRCGFRSVRHADPGDHHRLRRRA